MLNIYQQTIAKPISFEGFGLHSAKKSKVIILPGEADQKLFFKDLDKNNIRNANFKNVSTAKLCTTLENQFGVSVSTVEHLLAALYIAEIDNAVIEIDCNEVPIMDGSSKIFLDALKNIDIKKFKKRKF